MRSNSRFPGRTSPASRPGWVRCWPWTRSFAAATAASGPTGALPTARRCRSSSPPRWARSSWSGCSTPTISPWSARRRSRSGSRPPGSSPSVRRSRRWWRFRRPSPRSLARSRSGSTTPKAGSSSASPRGSSRSAPRTKASSAPGRSGRSTTSPPTPTSPPPGSSRGPTRPWSPSPPRMVHEANMTGR